MRSDQKSLKSIIRDLNQSTLNADKAIGDLRVAVDRAAQDLGERVNYAEHLTEKLTKQCKTSEGLLSKLTSVGRAFQTKSSSQTAFLNSDENNSSQNPYSTPFPPAPPPWKSQEINNSQNFSAPNSVQPNEAYIFNTAPEQALGTMQNAVNTPLQGTPIQNQQSHAQHTHDTHSNSTGNRMFPRLRLSALAKQGLPKS